jgi:hypothetical protein
MPLRPSNHEESAEGMCRQQRFDGETCQLTFDSNGEPGDVRFGALRQEKSGNTDL